MRSAKTLDDATLEITPSKLKDETDIEDYEMDEQNDAAYKINNLNKGFLKKPKMQQLSKAQIKIQK